MDDRSSSAKAMAMVSSVMTIAFMMVVPAFLGWGLDILLGTVVVFMSLGVVLGVVAGGWQLLKLVKYLEEQSDNGDSES